MVIYMYVELAWGQMFPWCPFLFRIIDILDQLSISCKIFGLNDIFIVFPIQMHRQPMLTLLKNRSRSSQGHDLYAHFILYFTVKTNVYQNLIKLVFSLI